MNSQPPIEAPPDRPLNWSWVLMVAVWLLLFMIVLAVGAAVVFWRQATSAKYAVAAITAEYQALNDQLTVSDAKVATLTKDRSELVDQLTATSKQLGGVNNQVGGPDAAAAKLTSERNALADQLAASNASLVKLTVDRDILVQQLVAAKGQQMGAAAPAPRVAPAVPANPGVNVAVNPPAIVNAKNPPVAGNAITDRLTLEYSTLLAGEANPAELDDAIAFFDQPDRTGHGTNFLQALPVIREHRTKAAIPLLLKYMVKQNETAPQNEHYFADALTILTGEIPDTIAPLDWWLKNKAALNTDLSKMSEVQLRRILAALLNPPFDRRRFERQESVADINSNLRSCMENIETGVGKGGRVRDRRGGIPVTSDRRNVGGVYPSDFCAAMTPLILEMTGWARVPKPAPDPVNASEFRFDLIPLLATLRKAGDAPDLDKISVDERQAACTRLMCLLVLRAAGENINGSVLANFADHEKSIQLRVIAIIAMQFAPSPATAGKLIKYLDDSNEQIVTAAVQALDANPPEEALPGLFRIINKLSPKEALIPAFNDLRKIKTTACVDGLVNFMTQQLKSTGSDDNLFQGLEAFYDITGCPRRAGVPTRQDVVNMCTWWQTHKNIKR